MNNKKVIEGFRGEYNFLSNFYSCPVCMNGITYPTSEHAFQSMKTDVYEEKIMISKCKTPKEAKQMGRKVTLRSDWEDIKLDMMDTVVWVKFATNKELKDKLLSTGDLELVEGNYWHDYYWGVCNGKGQNNLGKILMKVREELSLSEEVML